MFNFVLSRYAGVNSIRGKNQTRRLVLSAVVAAVIVFGSLLGGGTFVAAQAYDNTGMLSYGGWEIGSLKLTDGTYVYCLEPGTLTPVSPLQEPQVVEALRGYSVRTHDVTGWSGIVSTAPISGDPLMHMNYLLSVYGQADDPRERVAVQLALWALRAGTGEQAWLQHHFAWVKEHGGAWEVARADALATEARVLTAPTETHLPGALTLEWQSVSADVIPMGKLTYPSGTIRLQIEGAAFSEGVTEQEVSPETPGVLTWFVDEHVPAWTSKQNVTVTGVANGSKDLWPQKLVLHPPTDPVQQILGSGVGPLTEQTIANYPSVNLERESVFRPQLHTQVPQRMLRPGMDHFEDTVTVESIDSDVWPKRADSDGVTEFLPISLNGTLYGPFSSQQQLSESAPADSPIAATAFLVADSGPGEYKYVSGETAQVAGFYYWQWQIDASDQSKEVQSSAIIPENYVYRDLFGQPSEQHTVPMEVMVKTKLKQSAVMRDDMTVEDTLQVSSVSGEWFTDESGQNIPVVLRQYVYQEIRQPSRSSTVPEEANLVAEHLVTVSGERYQLTSGEILLPKDTQGWVSVRTCVRAQDQPMLLREMIVESCDDYGIPAESAFVEQQKLPTTGSEQNLSFVYVSLSSVFLLAGAGVLWIRYRGRSNRFQESSRLNKSIS